MCNRENGDPGFAPDEAGVDTRISEPSNFGGRARRGITVLFSRQIAGQLITLVGGIVLAWVLAPADFAVYAICSYFLSLFAVCGNAGMGSALIQQSAEPTPNELAVAFTTQLVLFTLFALGAFVAGPLLIAAHPELPEKAGYGTLFCWLVVAMWIGAQSWIPMAILERGMNYAGLARVELLQQGVTQAIVVALALAGWGVWSFAIGSLVGAVIGTVAIYVVSGWRPAIGWDRSIAWRLAKFGVPMQASWLAGLIGRGTGVLVLAPVLGATQFGIVLWAERLGSKLLFLASPLNRVAFNHFCRIGPGPQLAGIYSRYLLAVSLVIGAWAPIVAALGESVFVPLYGGDKWAPGVTIVPIYAIAATTLCFRDVSTKLLSATGRSTNSFMILLLEGIGRLVLAAMLVGSIALKAEAVAVLSLTMCFVLISAARAGKGCFTIALRQVVTFSVSMLIAMAFQSLLGSFFDRGLLWSLVQAASGVAAYIAAQLALAKREDRSWMISQGIKVTSSTLLSWRTFNLTPKRIAQAEHT